MTSPLSPLLSLLPPFLLHFLTTLGLLTTLSAAYALLQIYRTSDRPGWKYLHVFAVADAQGRIVREGWRPASWYKRPDPLEEEGGDDHETEADGGAAGPGGAGTAAGQGSLRQRQQQGGGVQRS